MKITGTITLEDYIEARQTLARSAGHTALRTAILALAMMLPSFLHGPSSFILYLAAGCCSLFVISVTTRWYYLHRLARPAHCASLFSRLPQPTELLLTPENLTIIRPQPPSRLLWGADFGAYHITPHLILATLPWGQVQILPKRWFTAPQLTELLSLLKTHLGRPRTQAKD